ncbi:hypothetical protein FB446DRAFT_707050 [Lentinula raphanica]|nr:hypothetical protein FB446DRAFT_707050 [Lentinula raphanica]
MNTYPLELIAQLGPVMFVAGLNQANQANTTNTTNSNSNTTNQEKGKERGKKTTNTTNATASTNANTSTRSDNANTIRRPPPAAAGHRKHQSMSDTMNMNPALTPSSSSSSATSSTSASSSSSSPGPDAQGETPTAAEAEREVQGEGDTEGGEEVDDDGEAEAEMSQQRGERERDPFALLASRLREMLLGQRRITVWDPPATGAATGVNGAEEKKIFQVVLVDKDVRFPPRKASLVGNDGDSSMSTSMSSVFPSSSSGLSTSFSSSSHTSSHSMSSFPSSSSSHQLPLLSPLTTSLCSTPHSPLSPLTRTSPVYPDGLIAPIWIRKHTMLVPAVFVLFVRMYEGGGRESELERLEREKDGELARMIGERKKEMSERGIKMTVVLLVSREMLDGSSARLDTRLGYVRRQSGLDSRAALFVLSPIGREELGEFLKSLQNALWEPAKEYYTAHSKRARQKRNRQQQVYQHALSQAQSQAQSHPHPPTLPSHSSLASLSTSPPSQPPFSTAPLSLPTLLTLESHRWTVRYEYKMASFAEFRGEYEVALKHFQDAYSALNRLFLVPGATHGGGEGRPQPPRTKRWAEARVLGDTMNIKIVKIYLYNNETALAVAQQRAHMGTFPVVVGLGGKEGTYEYWSWMCRMWRVFGELVAEGMSTGTILVPVHKPIPFSSTSPSPPNTLSSPTAATAGTNAYTALMPPWMYYLLAGECAERKVGRYVLDQRNSSKRTMDVERGLVGDVLELYMKAYEGVKDGGGGGGGKTRLSLDIARRIVHAYTMLPDPNPSTRTQLQSVGPALEQTDTQSLFLASRFMHRILAEFWAEWEASEASEASQLENGNENENEKHDGAEEEEERWDEPGWKPILGSLLRTWSGILRELVRKRSLTMDNDVKEGERASENENEKKEERKPTLETYLVVLIRRMSVLQALGQSWKQSPSSREAEQEEIQTETEIRRVIELMTVDTDFNSNSSPSPSSSPTPIPIPLPPDIPSLLFDTRIVFWYENLESSASSPFQISVSSRTKLTFEGPGCWDEMRLGVVLQSESESESESGDHEGYEHGHGQEILLVLRTKPKPKSKPDSNPDSNSISDSISDSTQRGNVRTLDVGNLVFDFNPFSNINAKTQTKPKTRTMTIDVERDVLCWPMAGRCLVLVGSVGVGGVGERGRVGGRGRGRVGRIKVSSLGLSSVLRTLNTVNRNTKDKPLIELALYPQPPSHQPRTHAHARARWFIGGRADSDATGAGARAKSRPRWVDVPPRKQLTGSGSGYESIELITPAHPITLELAHVDVAYVGERVPVAVVVRGCGCGCGCSASGEEGDDTEEEEEEEGDEEDEEDEADEDIVQVLIDVLLHPLESDVTAVNTVSIGTHESRTMLRGLELGLLALHPCRPKDNARFRFRFKSKENGKRRPGKVLDEIKDKIQETIYIQNTGGPGVRVLDVSVRTRAVVRLARRHRRSAEIAENATSRGKDGDGDEGEEEEEGRQVDKTDKEELEELETEEETATETLRTIKIPCVDPFALSFGVGYRSWVDPGVFGAGVGDGFKDEDEDEVLEPGQVEKVEMESKAPSWLVDDDDDDNEEHGVSDVDIEAVVRMTIGCVGERGVERGDVDEREGQGGIRIEKVVLRVTDPKSRVVRVLSSEMGLEGYGEKKKGEGEEDEDEDEMGLPTLSTIKPIISPELQPGDELGDICRIGISTARYEEVYGDDYGENKGEIPSPGIYEVYWKRMGPNEGTTTNQSSMNMSTFPLPVLRLPSASAPTPLPPPPPTSTSALSSDTNPTNNAPTPTPNTTSLSLNPNPNPNFSYNLNLGLTALLSVSPTAKLHEPLPMTLIVRNGHPSRTAEVYVLLDGMSSGGTTGPTATAESMSSGAAQTHTTSSSISYNPNPSSSPSSQPPTNLNANTNPNPNAAQFPSNSNQSSSSSSSPSFILSGLRAGRIPLLLSGGSEERLVWTIIPVECGYLRLPRVRVVDRRSGGGGVGPGGLSGGVGVLGGGAGGIGGLGGLGAISGLGSLTTLAGLGADSGTGANAERGKHLARSSTSTHLSSDGQGQGREVRVRDVRTEYLYRSESGVRVGVDTGEAEVQVEVKIGDITRERDLDGEKEEQDDEYGYGYASGRIARVLVLP